MDWQKYIVTDPKIIFGKPAFKGTRLAVDFILDLFSAGWSEKQILENYPRLTKDHLLASFAYAASIMREDDMFDLSDGTSG